MSQALTAPVTVSIILSSSSPPTGRAVPRLASRSTRVCFNLPGVLQICSEKTKGHGNTDTNQQYNQETSSASSCLHYYAKWLSAGAQPDARYSTYLCWDESLQPDMFQVPSPPHIHPPTCLDLSPQPPR
jgi:hypothetical protein